LQVHIKARPINEDPFGCVTPALDAAKDLDNDFLTPFSGGDERKRRRRRARSCQGMVSVLQSKARFDDVEGA